MVRSVKKVTEALRDSCLINVYSDLTAIKYEGRVDDDGFIWLPKKSLVSDNLPIPLVTMSSYTGHCICSNIQVQLGQQPTNSLRCYCRNCGRSGGGSSLNYAVDEADYNLQDTQSCLKSFDDTNTVSGNHVLRQFCGNCGSPILTKSPQFPGQVLVKASLFDSISRPSIEVFTDRRQDWESLPSGVQQA